MSDKDIKITPEEKEMLRRLMEDDEAYKKWDFFSGMNWRVPEPEFFMRGKPYPHLPKRWLIACGAIVAGIVLMLRDRTE